MYEYKIKNMQRDENNIVISVHFEIIATDDEDSFSHNYQTGLPAPKETPISYDSLTATQVITWVKDLVGEVCEEQADAELAAYKIRKKQTVSSGTPWEN